MKGGVKMLDSEKLKERVGASGLKKTFIAEQLGITYAGYNLKEKGDNEFTASEIQKLQKLLNLNDRDTKRIFFAGIVD